jgi:hypothetical protein
MQRDICFGAGYLPLTNIPLRGILIGNIPWWKKKTQIHLHEVKILQIHNARPEFVKKNITAINQSESSILI